MSQRHFDARFCRELSRGGEPPTPLIHSETGSARHIAPGKTLSLDGVSIAVSERADRMHVITPGWA